MKKQIIQAILLALLLLAAGIVSLDPTNGVKRALAQEDDTPADCDPTAVVLSIAANIRYGPGISYAIHSTFGRNTELMVVGRHPQYAWWRVRVPNGEEAWISDFVVQVRGVLADVPLVQVNGGEAAGSASWEPTSIVPCSTETMPNTPAPEEIQEVNGTWTPPVNVSTSGKASEPRSVVASDGTVHLIWKEEGLQQFLYANGDGTTWSEPLQIELPFGSRSYFPDLADDTLTPLFTPKLVATNDEQIHAFWTDDEQVLWHSALNGDFTDFDDWSQRRQVADSAVGVNVAADSSGQVYVSFIRPSEANETAPGVYVTRSEGTSDGASFAEPTLLYRSRYFVGIEEENAHTQIIAMAQENAASTVFVGWDNQRREMVFVVRSPDGGATWEEPLVVDRRQEDDDPEAAGPSRLMLAGSGQNILLVWQAAHGGETCSQFYRWSSDGGANWQQNERLATVPGCPNHMALQPADDGLLLLFTAAEQGVSLRAWNGNSWSEEQLQPELARFTDPETFRPVHLKCFQLNWLTGQHVFVAGCDEEGMKDIWATTRHVPAIQRWFEPASAWWSPRSLSTGATALSGVASVQLVADDDGRFHAFWTVQGSESINYAQYNSGQWTGNISLLHTSSGTMPSKVTVAYAGDNVIHAVWDSSDGSIYYSRADAAAAALPAAWSEPKALPAPPQNAATPDIVVDDSGTLYVVYAVPFNEGRGIYLLQSEDGGDTWSEPAPAFDGAQAGWQVVGEPDLALTTDGRVHLIWSQGTSSFDTEFNGTTVYYAYSDDGQSFRTAPVVQDAQANHVELVAGTDQTVHRFWQTKAESTTLFWHAYSYDGGQTWSDPIELSYVSGTSAPIMDHGGQLRLFQVDDTWLVHRQWDGVRWVTMEQVDWKSPLKGLGASAISSVGELMLVYAAESSDTSEGHEIVATGRNVETSAPIPTPQLTPTPVPSPTVTSSPTPAPTATRVFPTPVSGGNPPTMISNIGLQAAGIGGAIGLSAVAVVALLVVVRSAHIRQRRS